MKINKLFSSLLISSSLLFSHTSFANTMTFDDLKGEQTVQNGYGNLNWTNLIANATDRSVASPDTGYYNGTISPKIALFNGYGEAAAIYSDTPFTFNSASLTAGWNNGLNIQVNGYLSGKEVYSSLFTVDATAPSLINFNWTNVDRITLNSFGGTQVYFSGGGTNFVLDNLTINAAAVPEPENYAMMLLGLGVMGAVVSRRSK